MSLPAEQVADGMQRLVPTPFLTKTYQIVDDPSNNDVISWNAGGAAFIVWRPGDFARDVLPQRFKHNNFSSFVRQLNTYGFKKISSDRWEFAHELFRRGEQQLLCRIERRKVTLAAVAPADREASPASSGDEQVRSTGSSLDPEEHLTASSRRVAELVEENEQLRRENMRLASEHLEMKNLCGTIRRLMSDYASGSQRSSEGATAADASPLLQRMDGDGAEDERRNDDGGESSRLFGVQIGSKRAREEEELQLMPPEVTTASEGSICNPQEDEDLVRLSLSQVSNRRVCSDSNRYFRPARSDS